MGISSNAQMQTMTQTCAIRKYSNIIVVHHVLATAQRMEVKLQFYKKVIPYENEKKYIFKNLCNNYNLIGL